MKVTDEEIAEFRQLYREEFGLDLPPDEARAVIHRVFVLFEHFAVWLTKEKTKRAAAN